MTVDIRLEPDVYETALAMLLFLINAMNGVRLARIFADVTSTVQKVLVAADAIGPFMARIAKLPELDHAAILAMRTYGRATLQAHLLLMRGEDLRAVVEEATWRRKQLMVSAVYLGQAGVLDADRVAAIPTGQRHVDVANGLIALGQLFRDNWAAVKGMVMITAEDVSRAGELGDELHMQLGGKVPTDEETPNLTRNEVRARAWTLMVGAYEEARRALEFLEPERVDEIVPSLYTKQRRATDAGDEDEAEVEEDQEGGIPDAGPQGGGEGA